MASPIAALVVRVLADTSEIKENVKSIESTLTGMGSVATKVGAMLAGAFSVSAVLNFGREVLADADALVKLHDKTGLSIQGLQKFQIAGDDAGNTIEQMATAINQMQKRLVGDDKSALAALEALHLNLLQLRAMSPDRQFMEIADAIRSVQDPAEQVALAMAIFGKNGGEILPTLKRGFDDLKNASVGMSDETVKNLDAVGDAFANMWRQFKGGSANAVIGLWNALANAEAGVLPTQGELATDIELTSQTIAALDVQQVKAVDSTKKLTAAHQDLVKVLRGVTYEVHNVIGEVYKYMTAIPGARALTGRLAQDFAMLESHTLGFDDAIVQTMGDMRVMPGVFDHVIRDGIDPLSDRITGHLADALQRIPQMFIDAFTGGGGVMGALKGIGVSLLEAITKEILDPILAKFAAWLVKIAGLSSGMSPAGGGAGAGAGGAGAGLGLSAAAVAGIGWGALAAYYGLTNGADAYAAWFETATPEQRAAAAGLSNPNPGQSGNPRNERPGADWVGPVGVMPFEGFASGSGGMRDFGRGTPAILHGRESVVTEAQQSGLETEIRGLRRDMTFTLPAILAKAVATANVKAGRR